MDLEGVKASWDKLAKTTPVASMLPAGMSGIQTVDDLFDFGKREIDDVMNRVASLKIDVRRHRALDFGCGLGRSTQALAGYFDEVYGIDISPSIIELAEQHNRHRGRCKYLVNSASDLRVFEDSNFDFIWCYGVLHVIEPRYFTAYLKEFFRVLSPGGLMVFHQADMPAGTLKGLTMRLLPMSLRNSYHRRRYGFEVHGMKQRQVLNLIREAGGTVVHVEEERKTPGENWISFQYYAQLAT